MNSKLTNFRSFSLALLLTFFFTTLPKEADAQTCPGFTSSSNSNFTASLLGGFVNVTYTGDRTVGGSLRVDTFIPSFSVVSDPNNPNSPSVLLAPQTTSQEVAFLPYSGPNYFEIPVFLVTFDSVATVFNVQEVAWAGVFDTGAAVTTGAADFITGNLSLTLNNLAQSFCLAAPPPNPIAGPGVVFDIPLAIGLDLPAAGLLAGIPKISNLLFIYDANSIVFGAPAALAAGQAALGTCTQNLTLEQAANGACQTNLGICSSDLGVCNTSLGTCNSDLGTCNASLGTCTTDLGISNTNLGICNTDLGICNTDLGISNASLGTCNTDLGICNSDLGTCSTDLGICNGSLGTCNTDLGISNASLTTCNINLGIESAANASCQLANNACQPALTSCQNQLSALGSNSCPANTSQQLQQLANAKAQIDGIDVSNLRRSISLLNQLARTRYSHSPSSVRRIEATRRRALKLNSQNIQAMKSLDALKVSLGL